MKIVGDYHTHTTYSDGKTGVMDMVRAAKERGLSEIAITDHGFGKWVGGLRKKNLEKLRGDIESARAELPVLFGVEANNINCSGKIDIPEDIKKDFDIILFGVHVRVRYCFSATFTFLIPNLFWRMFRWAPKGRIRRNTAAVKHVIENNKIDIWTHPNLYFRVNVVEIAKVCAERGTLVELNSSRISFRPIDFERMAATGAKFIIGSDAHTPKRIGEITRVEEFLKSCDYNEDNIINLKQTLTEYKNKDNKRENDISGRNQERDTAKAKTEPKPKKRFWRR